MHICRYNSMLAIERRGGRVGGGSAMLVRPVGQDHPQPWNKGGLVGQKKPLQPKNGWSIRVRLEIARRLSLSETRSGCIDGAIRLGLARAEYGRRSRWGALPENPYSRIGASGFDCSNLRKIEVNAEDAARQIRRHGQGSRVGSSRSAFHNIRSAIAIAARSDDLEFPLIEVAGPQCRHMRDPGHE